jgi:UPF0042 nucleotide-binding protein
MKTKRIYFWIVTGLSGAGKSQAINSFEDFGFFCVDNLPVTLVPKMAELCAQPGRPLQQVALGIDIREGGFLRELFDTIEKIKKQGVDCRILFLDADDKTLIRRFSETRRRHPLGTSVRHGVIEERKRLLKIKERADKIIDTSAMTLSDLKATLGRLLKSPVQQEMHISVQSFGFKYGLPPEADLVWDVRFMPNPNYIPHLRDKTGLDLPVRRYVLSTPEARRFGKKFFALVFNSLPYYAREGKSYLTVAIGCTGGRHRSVVMANALQEHLTLKGIPADVHHRDIER